MSAAPRPLPRPAVRTRRGPGVVGVGTRPVSWAALAWAINEATRHNYVQHLVHAGSDAEVHRPTAASGSAEPGGRTTPDDRDEHHGDVRSIVLANAVARACSLSPGPEVTVEVSDMKPSNPLVRASRLASEESLR